MNNYIKLIEEWAAVRGLLPGEPSKQLNKLVEELGELAEGFNKNKPEQVKDSLGDMFVVMTIFAKMNGLSLDDCIKEAYNTIKDRDGMMVDGVFVKKGDLGAKGLLEIKGAAKLMGINISDFDANQIKDLM